MALTCHLYRDGTIVEEDFDPTRISDALQDEGTLVWLDVAEPSDQDLAMLREEFDLPRVVMEDVRERDQRPHVEAFGDAFFIVMYAFTLDGGRPIPHELHAIVGPSYLVTLRYTPAFDMERVRRRWKQEEPELAKEGGGFLLHPLLDEVVDTYLEVLDGLELRSEEVEEEVFGESPAGDIQATIFQEKKRLLEFRRRVMPLREVLDLLQEEHNVVTPALRAEYKDVADHVVRTLEFVDSVRELLTTALDAHLSMISVSQNEDVRRLAAWAAIIAVPTMIVGIYGMNFDFMPELRWRFGYPLVLGVTAAICLTLYVQFKKAHWL